MALVVHRPALASPADKSGLSVTEFFTEKLKNSNIVLVPPSFELSGDLRREFGEEAEKKVVDSIEKCVQDIPGLQILCFHGVRVRTTQVDSRVRYPKPNQTASKKL